MGSNRLGSDGAVSFGIRPAERGVAGGLMLCPVPVAVPSGLDIYRLAYEQARDAAQASWFEWATREHRN